MIRGICESISLDDVRLLLAFFDERGSGKIQVADVVAQLQVQIN